MSTGLEALARYASVCKSNSNHLGPGSPEGGQFTSGSGGKAKSNMPHPSTHYITTHQGTDGNGKQATRVSLRHHETHSVTSVTIHHNTPKGLESRDARIARLKEKGYSTAGTFTPPSHKADDATHEPQPSRGTKQERTAQLNNLTPQQAVAYHAAPPHMNHDQAMVHAITKHPGKVAVSGAATASHGWEHSSYQTHTRGKYTAHPGRSSETRASGFHVYNSSPPGKAHRERMSYVGHAKTLHDAAVLADTHAAGQKAARASARAAAKAPANTVPRRTIKKALSFWLLLRK